MKIINGKYPQVVDDTYVKQADGTKPILNKVFYERLVAYFKNYNVKVTGFAYRTIQKQAELYLAWINDPTHNNQAAYPGTSWHNVALAFDVNSQGTDPDGTGHYPATMEADFLLPPTQQTMNKWGLCIPMWKGAKTQENWHIQPIESLGQPVPQWYADEDDLLNNTAGYRSLSVVTIPGWTGDPVYMEGKDVQRSMRAFGITEYGKCDATWSTACKAYQTKNGLVADASCGPATWGKINTQLGNPTSDWETMYNECKAELDAANAEIASLNAQITDLNNKLTAANVEINRLNTQLNAANLQIANLNIQLAVANDKLTKAEQELVIAQKALTDMTADRDAKVKELTTLSTCEDTKSAILSKY